MQKSSAHIFKRRLQIPLGIVCLPQKIIDTDLIVIRQSNEQFIRQLLGPGFDVAVFSLRDADGIGNLLLGQIRIFPQILYPVVQPISPPGNILPQT